MVKQQIKVEYIDHMGSDLSTVNSARVSFDKESDFDADAEEYGVLKQSDVKLIKYLAKHKHMTPFRHNQIQIRCHAPIFIARQLGKHQAGLSWNEVSRRYVDSEPEFYIPDEWRGRPDGSIKQGSGGRGLEYAIEAYAGCCDDGEAKYAEIDYEDILQICLEWYRCNSHLAPEMTRMVLPQSMMTSWYWTGNLLSFAHVYKERIAEGAQLEARYFAEELDKIIRELYPIAWSALVDGDK